MSRLLWVVVLLWSCAAMSVFAQQQFPVLEKGFRAEKLYQFDDVDSVNVFNGNLLINLGIGPESMLDGGLSYQLRLSFNSKPWDLTEAGTKVHAVPSPRASAGLGWTIGMGRFVAYDDPSNLSFADLYEGPDGGDHLFNGPGSVVTSDGSNLRIQYPSSDERKVEFPDGTIKRFARNAVGVWNLVEIGSTRSTDAVTITYGTGNPAGCSPTTSSYWTINDSKGRVQTVCFSNLLVNSVARPMVDRVVLASPGGTATYGFGYVAMTIPKPIEDTDSDSSTWRQTHDVQLLDSLTLPDGSQYRFAPGGGGVLGTMTLPTMGKITYQYGGWQVPSTALCSNTYGLGFGFGSAGHGVEVRTFTPAVPSGQTPATRTWLYTRQLGPQPAYVSKWLCEVVTGTGTPPELVPVELYDELLVTITDPAGHQTTSHFSVWPGGDIGRTPDPDTSPAGFKRIHYGYPYGRYDAAQDRYLSQEIFDCTGACTLERSIWVRHEPQPRAFDPNNLDPPVPNRLLSQRTVFHDDPVDCVGEGAQPTCARTSVDYADWDGYGHYREVSTTREFHDDEDVRKVTTAWNKVGGTARIIGAGEPWLLNTYESVTTVEGGVTAVEQACFDLSTGLLQGRRTLRGLSPAATDLLASFEYQNGNTVAENFFGGDVSTLAANQAFLCSALAALEEAGTQPEYRIDHEWQHGFPVRAQYDGAPFFSTDLTVDLNGLVTASRDPQGRETTYHYDSKWRLESVSSPGQAITSYEYTSAAASGTTLTQPAKVVETTDSAVAGTVKREYQYDAFGRLWRQKQLMPDGQWNVRETLYDTMARKASVSEAASLQGVANELSFHPPHQTSFSYDLFGRATLVSLPDSTSTFMSYVGTRTTTRTATIAGEGGAETLVGKREEYDALGRLRSVTENADLAPGDGIDGEQTTEYTYDIGGRLSGVSMAGASGTQLRTFTYDKRGLLLQERHPEVGLNGNGIATYSQYDARGHAGRKVIGSAIDLRFEYDAAERLIRTRDAEVGNREIELFSWDCIRFDVTQPCASATHAGQLAASARYNYDPELGTIAVTQANQYDPVTGRLVRRDYSVGDGEVGGVTQFTGESFFFIQNYNDLGLIDTVTYPCRVSSTGCLAGDLGRSIQHGYLNGQLKSVGTWASNMTYRPNGTIDTITHGSGSSAVLEKWEADPHGMARPRRIYSTNAAGTQELRSSGNYEFDGSGNVKTIGNTRYAYDPFGRLMSWTTTGTSGSYSTIARGYDDFGNYLYTMESGCGPAPQSVCYSTSFLSRDIEGTTNRYVDNAYDTAGNVTLDFDQRAYTWDPLGMMTSATAGDRTFRYIYTAGNERIAAVERVPVASVLRNRTTFTLRGTGNQLLSTWTDDWTSGNRVFTRKEDTIWRGSQLLARAAGATAMNYSLDHLGSPRLITNTAGAILDQQHFEPFGGGGLFGSGALQFTGHERDRANLGGGAINLPDYMHARYYDSGLGRFLSVDPVLDREKALKEPQRWNRYAYALNNPIKYVDPDGMTERTGWQAGVVVNKSNQVIWIAADHNGAKVVIPLRPGERSTSFLTDTDAVIIGSGQKIDGETTGAFKIGSSDVDVEGKNAGKLELDADGEWVVNAAAGRAGHVSPATATANGWVVPAGQQGARAAQRTKQQLQQERQREQQKNNPQPQPKPQPKNVRDWWPFW